MSTVVSAGWPAPTATGPVSGHVEMPGSKSATNRALVLAALAEGPSRLQSPLRSRDTELMAAALQALGVQVASNSTGDWLVTPGPLQGPATIDCGLAGTVMRFVPPLSALATGGVRFDGDPRARQRPLGKLLSALMTLGADISPRATGLPFTVRGRGELPGGFVEIDASSSSQFVSGLLLTGAAMTEGVEVAHVGGPLPSRPHVEMTIEMLRSAGVTVDTVATDRWRVWPGKISPLDIHIEPDLSNAAPFLAAAMVTAGEVTIAGWPARTSQAGDQLRDLLTRMGATVTWTMEGLTVRGPDRINGLTADLRSVGELTPVLAAVAALADSPSHLTGIGHLRGHETDRLAALATELNAVGGRVIEHSDGLTITPAALHAAAWRGYDDHRMAQAGTVLGLVVPGIVIDDIATTAKTLPDFVGQWHRLLGVTT